MNKLKAIFFVNSKKTYSLLKSDENGKVYLPGLNGLRAIAAISVLISHTFQERDNFGLPKVGALAVGSYSVTAFFTLSGFLITYLLLKEKDTYEKINIKEFYLRRIFRIWPLYYFYIILTLFFTTITFGYFSENVKYLWLFVFFVPNIAFNLNTYPACLGHLWSIGIEEQFYAFWPHLVGKTNKLKRNIVLFIIFFLFLKLSVKLISIYFNTKIPFSIISSMSFDCMAIGALFAIIYKEGLIIKRKILILGQLLFWLFFILTFLTRLSFFSIYGNEVFSLLTGFFILGQLSDKNCLISLERPLFNFLGKISFGLYVYHPLVIFLFKYLLMDVFYFKIPNTCLLIFFIVILTIVVSFLSYQYIESYFLEIRNNRNKIKVDLNVLNGK